MTRNCELGELSRRVRIGLRAIVAIALLAVGSPAASAPVSWIASWAASPAPPQPEAAGVRPERTAPKLQNQTIVQVVRLSAGGEALRIRLTNEYGQSPLVVGAVRVSVLDPSGKAGAAATVTFAGASGATIPARAPLVSDPIPLRTGPLSRLRIALYVKGQPECTCHMVGLQPIQLSPPGDFTTTPFESLSGPTTSYRAFLSEVDVASAKKRAVIVALGDSITDGVGSTLGANRRWPDLLAERLAAMGSAAPAVVNAGIAGNRVLSEPSVRSSGENLLARLDRDVLSLPGVTHVILLEGINDIGGGGATPPSAESLILGYTQVVARARARGVKVIGATLTPFLGGSRQAAAVEAVRQKVNAWIRTGGAFDGVVDFDAAVRDGAAPNQMRADLHSGDWLHPNDAGYRTMAGAINLGLFR